MDWLKTVAPTLATALGGPLAGIAVNLIGGALGMSEPTQESIKDALTSGQLSGEQIAALKKAEIEARTKEKELGFRFAELDVRDRESARAREAATSDPATRVLGFTVIGSFVAMVGATLLGYAAVDSALAGTLVGYLSAKAEQVLSYYFGSSAGSKLKTELLGVRK